MLPRLVSALALCALLVVGSPVPAHADVVGSTSADDVVLRNTCQRHPVRYDVTVSPGTSLWRLTIQLVSPSGRTSEGTEISSVEGDPTSGVVRVLICGSSDPGTYRVRTTGFYQVVPLVQIPVSIADSTFEVRRATTRTSARATTLAGGRHRLVARVVDERRRGFRPTDGAEVRFQRKVGGTWRAIPGSARQTTDGVARAVVRLPAGATVRAVTGQAGYLAGSTSRAFRLR